MSPGLQGSSESVGTRRAQRGFVSLLFADLCDFTQLSEDCDPEDTQLLRTRFEALASEIIARHHGLITQIYGDGLLAVFGLPDPDEDHPRRAIEAALELHASVRAQDFELRLQGREFEVRLHSGIHSGLVLAGEGDALHGRYDLIGDAVNTASRLCAAATRDQILASDATLCGIEAFFELETLPALRLKGKAAPVIAHRVLERTHVHTRFDARAQAGLTQLVGRERELERLEAATRSLLRGETSVLALVGAAGVGKTRVLEEFRLRRAASSVRVYRGYCEHYGEAEPLQAFVQIMRQVFALGSDLARGDAMRRVQEQLLELELELEETSTLPVLLHLLSLQVLPALAADPSQAQQSIVQTLGRLFAALCARSPLVLQLDDWHWSDELSQHVLHGLLEALAESPALVLLSLRAGEAEAALPARVEVLPLAPFDELETRSVVGSLRPDELDEQEIELLHRQSGGNPLFLEELCRALPRGASLPSEAALQQLGIPTTVRGVIHARVAQLPAAEAELLRTASVIGVDFTPALLQPLLPPGPLEELLASLEQSDLLHRDATRGGWRFKHGIARDAIYESVRVATRREAHRRIASTLAADSSAGRAVDQSETLAYHHRGAGEYASAARYANQAGDKALASSSLDRARAHYTSALEAYDQLPASTERQRAWLAVSAKWAFVHMYSPSWSQLQILERASNYASELQDESAAARASHWLGWMYYSLGDQANAGQHCRRALELADRAGESKLIGQLWLNLGQSHAAACDYSGALSCFERGLEWKRQHGSGRGIPAGFAYALGCRALVAADRGDFLSAALDMAEALDAVRDSGHPAEGSLCALEAMIQICRGSYAQAAQAAEQARHIAGRVRGGYVLAMSQVFASYARHALDRSAPSLEALRRALDTLESRRIGLFLSFCQALLADALAREGADAEAREYAMRALARAESGDPVGQIFAYRVLARLAQRAAASGTASARALLSKALDLAERRESRRESALTQLLAAELALPGAQHERAAASRALEAMGMDMEGLAG